MRIAAQTALAVVEHARCIGDGFNDGLPFLNGIGLACSHLRKFE